MSTFCGYRRYRRRHYYYYYYYPWFYDQKYFIVILKHSPLLNAQGKDTMKQLLTISDMSSLHVAGMKLPLAAGKTLINCSRGLNCKKEKQQQIN